MFAEVLSKINHDPNDHGSLGGVKLPLRRASKLQVPGVTRKSVQEYQRSEQAYTLHKLARRRLSKNHTYVARSDAQWHADLADMHVSPSKTAE